MNHFKIKESLDSVQVSTKHFLAHLLFVLSPIRMICVQVGGVDEYDICNAIKEKRITKPVVAWILGTCADMFTSEV